MQCDAACLSLPDREQTQLRVYGLDFPAGKGFMQDQMVLPMAGTSPGKAYQTGKPLRFGTAPKSLAPVALKVNVEEGFESGCFLPIMRRNRTLGVLHLLDRRKEAFSEEDVDFLRQVASQVAIALENALEFSELSESKERLAEEGLYLRDEIRTEHHFEDILGNSDGLRQVLRQVETVAPNDTTVLIQGETGTGKELVARAIHALSSRQDNIFVKLNCAAIPLGLLESELFGHERGAFTGAISRKVGRFESAHKGTLFLDEVGDIPLELQAKLLRVLQEQEFERLGGTRSIRTDVRLVAATNRDLGTHGRAGNLSRRSLLSAECFSDTHPTVTRSASMTFRFWCDILSTSLRSRRTGRSRGSPSPQWTTLVRYAWPGNIRELQNFIERAVILTEGAALRVPLAELREGRSKSSPGRDAERSGAQSRAASTARHATGFWVGRPAQLRGWAFRARRLIYRMRRAGIERPSDQFDSVEAVDSIDAKFGVSRIRTEFTSLVAFVIIE